MATDTEDRSKFQTQIVNIAGEMVSFTPTGLPKGEYSVVQFNDYYKPQGLSQSDTNILMNALRDLFSSTSLPIFDKELGQEIGRPLRAPILPPCDEVQKDLVMRSLQYRFDLLRQELYVRGIRSFKDMKKRMEELKKHPGIGSLEGQDTMDVRRNLKHFYALKQLMDDYEKSQQCFVLTDKAFGEMELDLTDERARELLKQFIFFTLQAHHPLQEFKKTDPTAPAFVKRLELKPLKEQFPKFMTTYKGNKLPIPESIARVLESIGADPGVLEEEVKRRIQEGLEKEKQKILTFVLEYFPGDSPFWRTIGEEKDIYRIVEKLIEIQREATGEVDRLTKANTDLEAKRKACEAEKLLLQQQLSRITSDAAKLRGQLEIAGKQEAEVKRLTDALAKATAENAAKQERATQQLEEAAALIEANRVRIDQLTRVGEELAGRVRELDAEVARLKLVEAAAKEDARALVEAHQRALTEEKERTTAERAAKQTAMDARDAAQRDLETTRTEIAGKDTIIEANTARILALEKAVNDCETKTTTLREDLRKKTEEAERLGQEVATKETRRRELEESQAALVARAETAEGEAETLEEQVAELRKEIAALNFDLSDKEASLLAARSEAESLAAKADIPTQKAAKLKSELDEAKAQLDAARTAKESLTADVARLEEEVRRKDELYSRLQGEFATQKQELGRATKEGQAAQEKVESLSAQLYEAQEILTAQDRQLLDKDKQHGEQIAELTGTFKAQVAEASEETAREKKRAEEAQASAEAAAAELGKQKEVYEGLKDAIEALLTIEDDPSSAFAPVEEDVKENLRTIFLKLQSASRSSSAPSSPTARRAEHMVSQCQNVLLLTYLWQTNFPGDDGESQKLYKMINTIFSSGPYPGREGRTLPGVYEGNALNVKFYAPLLKRLLGLFSFGNPSPEGAAVAREISVTPDEIALIEKLLRVLTPIEAAYKAGDAGEARSDRESSFLAQKSRENMIRHHPNVEAAFVREYLKLDKTNGKVVCILGEESQLSYPSVFYMFMIVLRDSLDQVSTSLRREGQCPLPTILRKA
jgi:hypothetical protein